MRIDFHQIANEKDNLNFIDKYRNSAWDLNIPYLAAATMKKAEYAFSPFQKFKYFNQGKKELELYIQKKPECVEARYIRYIVQKKIPTFLGYNKNMDTDKQYILENLAKSSIPPDYQEFINDKIKELP
ncbi:MAG: hypothetical protein KDC53_09245 [Saprospiraceae bacterium]|nr:hypothetical protein [Saprospiraceae bacterium]